MEQKNYKLNFVYCHRKPERSFFYQGNQFPLCARCTGIHIGYISFPVFLFSFITLNFWLSIALILPTLIDGITQAYCNRESNNYIRLITGLFAGIGLMSLISIVGKYFGELFYNLIFV